MSRPTLTCPGDPSDTGAYRIAWSGDEGASFRLEEDGELLYEGPELATTVSGRPAGEYVYRVGVIDEEGVVGSWSDPCQVSVSPPSMSLALTLFGLGLLAFVAVLLVITRGHRRHKRGELQ